MRLETSSGRKGMSWSVGSLLQLLTSVETRGEDSKEERERTGMATWAPVEADVSEAMWYKSKGPSPAPGALRQVDRGNSDFYSALFVPSPRRHPGPLSRPLIPPCPGPEPLAAAHPTATYDGLSMAILLTCFVWPGAIGYHCHPKWHPFGPVDNHYLYVEAKKSTDLKRTASTHTTGHQQAYTLFLVECGDVPGTSSSETPRSVRDTVHPIARTRPRQRCLSPPRTRA